MRQRVRLLLDTHVWVWLALGIGGRIPQSALRSIEQAGESGDLFVSIISVWEVGLLSAKQRLVLPMSAGEWISRALSRSEIKLVGLNKVGTVLDSVSLPGKFHSDPADRILIATARAQRAALVTHDEKIIEYGESGNVRVVAV